MGGDGSLTWSFGKFANIKASEAVEAVQASRLVPCLFLVL